MNPQFPSSLVCFWRLQPNRVKKARHRKSIMQQSQANHSKANKASKVFRITATKFSQDINPSIQSNHINWNSSESNQTNRNDQNAWGSQSKSSSQSNRAHVKQPKQQQAKKRASNAIKASEATKSKAKHSQKKSRQVKSSERNQSKRNLSQTSESTSGRQATVLVPEKQCDPNKQSKRSSVQVLSP